jgi:hypothetical protein
MTSEIAESSKTSLWKLRVDVMGSSYWAQVACNLLKRAGVNPEVVDPHGRFALLKWALRGRWRRFDVIHRAGGIWRWQEAIVFLLVPRPIIWHWIGTDICSFQECPRKGWKGFLVRLAAHRWATSHLVDSPELAGELKAIGITADVVRLLPELIEARVEPLPECLSVLSYWTDGRKDFYGGEIVFQLAKEFPNVEFRILAASGRGETAPANVKFLGYRQDMSDIYNQSSVLIRIPQHDSLSAMVLEMLARGRYVIYNKKLPGCHFAGDLQEARKALFEIRQYKSPNSLGAQTVKEMFSLDREAEALRRVYEGLFPPD